ncbi:MAG: fused MFS/spermidine synthase [Thermodesulfovibrionales bacterium]
MDKISIQGNIVCQSRDRFGEISIADYNGIRSLYFGGGVMQSCMNLDQPHILLTEYSKAMMSTLIFRHRPESTLLIGLGGGSLVHFLLQACPDCSIDVVEVSEEVINLAREYFYLPKENEQLRVFHAAGQDFIKQQEEAAPRYDLILVDAFDESGPAAILLGKKFLSDCRGRMKADGVFAMNLWNRLQDNFPVMFDTIRTAFDGHALRLLLGEVHDNAIVLGFENPSLFCNMAIYRPEARRLQREWGINFPRFLKHLYWQNFGTAAIDDTYRIPAK